jgi:hypothetical protein
MIGIWPGALEVKSLPCRGWRAFKTISCGSMTLRFPRNIPVFQPRYTWITRYEK